MTKRTRKYLVRKKRGIVWQNYGHIKVRLSGGPLLYVCQDDPIDVGNGEYMYTVKLAEHYDTERNKVGEDSTEKE